MTMAMTRTSHHHQRIEAARAANIGLVRAESLLLPPSTTFDAASDVFEIGEPGA